MFGKGKEDGGERERGRGRRKEREGGRGEGEGRGMTRWRRKGEGLMKLNVLSWLLYPSNACTLTVTASTKFCFYNARNLSSL